MKSEILCPGDRIRSNNAGVFAGPPNENDLLQNLLSCADLNIALTGMIISTFEHTTEFNPRVYIGIFILLDSGILGYSWSFSWSKIDGYDS